MTQAFQPGQHPDADQLNAFVEHALPAHEQQQMLAHLAGCADCRAVVYFAQPDSLEAPTLPQPVAIRRPLFSGWRLIWPVAAALACLVLITVHLHKTRAGDQQLAATKPAGSEQTLLAPPATTRADVAVPAKPVPSPLRNAEAVPEAAPNVFYAARTTPAASLPGNPLPPGASMPGRNTAATPNPDLGAASTVAPGQESSLGFVGGIGLIAANPQLSNGTPTSPPTKTSSPQGGLIAGNAVHMQLRSAAAQYDSSSADAQRSVIRQVQAAPPPSAAPPPIPPATAAAANETVTVTSAATLEVESSASSEAMVGSLNGPLPQGSASMMKKQPALPSRLPVRSTVSNLKQELAIDTAGTLFRSEDAGVTWKQVPVQWSGHAVKVALSAAMRQREVLKNASSPSTPAAKPATSAPAEPTTFELTTDAGDLWSSPDGRVWKHK